MFTCVTRAEKLLGEPCGPQRMLANRTHLPRSASVNLVNQNLADLRSSVSEWAERGLKQTTSAVILCSYFLKGRASDPISARLSCVSTAEGSEGLRLSEESKKKGKFQADVAQRMGVYYRALEKYVINLM